MTPIRLLRLTQIIALCTPLAMTACGESDAPAPTASAPAAQAPATVPLSAGWTATEGISAPESVYYDQDSGYIFSSQIVGMPDQRDGNGRIAKLGGDGTVIDANWVTGLNAPKGLRSYNGTLWVADIDQIVGIDIASAKITARITPPGAMFLNDVATGPDGTVYATDTFANKIFAVKDGVATVFDEGEQLEWANGLLVDGDRLIVGGWGKPKPDFSTEVPGHLFTVDLKTKKKTLITPKPFANIDGLELDGKGGYILTDYTKGKLMQVSATGDARELQTFMPGTADLAFVASQNIAVIPHMNENKLVSYDLSGMLK